MLAGDKAGFDALLASLTCDVVEEFGCEKEVPGTGETIVEFSPEPECKKSSA